MTLKYISAYSQSLNNEEDTAPVHMKDTEDANVIDVDQFDYMGHYTESDDPRKVVVAFTIVPQDDFLGGNVVPTNTKAAGVYDGKGTIEENFDVPNVDVPIKATGYVESQSIYYNDIADILDMIQMEAVNGINNRFVNITYTIKDANGNTINSCTVPAGTADMNWSNGDLYDEEDTSFSNENTNHPRLTETTKYTVETTVHPIYNRTYSDQTNTEDAYVYVFKPVVTQHDGELARPANQDITPIDVTDVDADHPPYNYYQWICEEATEENPVKKPDAKEPRLDFTIKVGDQEVQADANGLYQYYVEDDTDFTITAVTVNNYPHNYTYGKIVKVKDDNGNVQFDDDHNPITVTEEEDRTIGAATATLTPSDKIMADNTKSIFYNTDKDSDSGVFTITVAPQVYTVAVTKTFQGDYNISEDVKIVFTPDPAEGGSAVEQTISFDGSERTKTGSVTLALGKTYTVTEEFPSAPASQATIKDEQYRTSFTTGTGLVVSSRTDAQGDGNDTVTGENIVFSYDGEVNDEVTLAIVNRDISPEPIVTGVSEDQSNFAPIIILGVLAVMAGAGGVYYVYRKNGNEV